MCRVEGVQDFWGQFLTLIFLARHSSFSLAHTRGVSSLARLVKHKV